MYLRANTYCDRTPTAARVRAGPIDRFHVGCILAVTVPLPTPLRRVAGCLLLLLLALPASESIRHVRWNLHLWRRLQREHRPAPQIAVDRRIRGFASYLPRAGSIGLVQADAGRAADARQILFVVQYALAPRVVTPTADAEFVIVYGPAGGPALDGGAYALVETSGSDLRLFRRVQR